MTLIGIVGQIMSSNIEIEKTCIYCNNKFIAKTLKTKYCSHTCNSRHYKMKKRSEKLNDFSEDQINKPKAKVDLRHKEYLSIPETALLIGISKRTVYRLIEKQELIRYKLGGRTIIKRIDIDNLFSSLV